MIELTREQFEEAVGEPLRMYAFNCHMASVALVNTGVLGYTRVARGFCEGVPSQHSWVVVGHDCYDEDAVVVDPTLWSYTHEEPHVWTGRASERPHRPHGAGSIWAWGRPDYPTGEVVTLDADFSPDARHFLDLLGPLDLRGWRQLAHAPVGGWPSSEIIAAMYEDERITHYIPIDIVGMVTNLNPNGLYLPTNNVVPQGTREEGSGG